MGTVPMPGLGTVAGISERPEGGHESWFGYTDHTTPASVYHYDARTDSTTLWASAPGSVEVPPVEPTRSPTSPRTAPTSGCS